MIRKMNGSSEDIISKCEFIKENVKYIDYVEVIDSTSLKIVLTEPVTFFEYNLTFPIMCQKYYEGEDFVNTTKLPIGTGKFKIAESANFS